MKRNKHLLQVDLGLLIIRVFAGLLMLVIHGLQKLLSWDRLFHSFPDPFAIGSEASFLLTIFAEVICSLLVIIGFFARYAVIPLIITMLVATFIIHGNDPWTQRELPLLYAVSFTTLFFTGAGKYSVDYLVNRH